MCGLIGYIGSRDANNILIDCLKRMEYRGYDSAGIGIIDDKIHIFKEIGKISNLEKIIPRLKGNIGIGHTRWATHGEVNQRNAHPHLSSNKKISIVHNGILENFKILKEALKSKGYSFTTDTDTEVIANLIEDEYKGNLEKAVISASKKIQGSFALVIMSEDEPNKLIGVHRESSLVVGIGDNENFLASDVPAFLKYTNRVIYLEEGDYCVITKKDVKIFDGNNKIKNKNKETIKWDINDAKKSGFPHFMLKEIFEQPESVEQSIAGRISEINRSITLPDKVEYLLNDKIDSISIVACGTSYYAGLLGKYFIERLTNIPVFVEIASEYRYFGIQNKNSLVIAISQSGETADTIAAIKKSIKSSNKTLVITNVIGSTATRITDAFILTQCGPEISVAATKTFSSQVVVLFLLGLKIAFNLNMIGPNEIYNEIKNLRILPRQLRLVLDKNEEIKKIAELLYDSKSVFFIGRGLNYPISLEGALKLKEISYIYSEGYAAGEIKHGPFALLTKETPVIALVSRNSTYDKMLINISEIKARGSMVIAVADDKDTEVEKYVDYVIRFPPTRSNLLTSLSIMIILQLIAYNIANLRGCSIDKPRNLAKSVTVE